MAHNNAYSVYDMRLNDLMNMTSRRWQYIKHTGGKILDFILKTNNVLFFFCMYDNHVVCVKSKNESIHFESSSVWPQYY